MALTNNLFNCFAFLCQVAIEAAGFERDILAALRPLPRLSLGMVPLGQVQASAFECGETGECRRCKVMHPSKGDA